MSGEKCSLSTHEAVDGWSYDDAEPDSIAWLVFIRSVRFANLLTNIALFNPGDKPLHQNANAH